MLRDNQSTLEGDHLIKHNDDYDSELTEHEESEDEKEEKPMESKPNKNITKENYISDSGNESEDELINKKNKIMAKKAENIYHRSIRVDEVKLSLKESPGALGRELNELIRKMTSSWSVVNPSAVFSIVCKRFI